MCAPLFTRTLAAASSSCERGGRSAEKEQHTLNSRGPFFLLWRGLPVARELCNCWLNEKPFGFNCAKLFLARKFEFFFLWREGIRRTKLALIGSTANKSAASRINTDFSTLDWWNRFEPNKYNLDNFQPDWLSRSKFDLMLCHPALFLDWPCL